MTTNHPIERFKQMKTEMIRFMMMYKFALNELETKVEILNEEFQMLHDYNPIEHTASRLKTPESILQKLHRKGAELSFQAIREHVKDIAGMRITCSFISDIYRIKDMLANQRDLTILEVKDYIHQPKPNGYRSMHMLVEVPVFMSDREENVCVEVQIRTIAMDFWASLEHKIYYKFNQSVPSQLLQELKTAADVASALDQKMEQLHHEVLAIKEENGEADDLFSYMINNEKFTLPAALLNMMNGDEDDEGK